MEYQQSINIFQSMFLEDYTSDSKYRNKAKSMAKKLIAMKADGFDDYLHGDVVIIDGDKIDPVLDRYVIILAKYNKRPAAGAYAGVGRYTGGDEYDRVMVVYVLSDKIIKNKAWDGVILDEQRLVHEFIHILDQGRAKEYTPSVNADGSITPEDYYNSPFEFNAYYQDGLVELDDTLKLIKKKMKSFYDEKMASWDAFKPFAINKFDSSFRENLNTVYNKKFLKRLFQFYQEVRKP